MKVIVRRVSTGVAAVSSLVIATGAGSAGCGGEIEGDDELLGTTDDELNPGTGKLELQLVGNNQTAFTLAASTTDEFVRVGQALNLTFPAWVLWTTLYPNDPLPDDNRLKQLKVTVKVTYYDRLSAVSTQTLALASWQSTITGLYANTGQLVIPAKVDLLRFSITIKDALNAAAINTLEGAEVASVPVFSGDLPNKTLFFDNTQGGTKRQRIIEGDSIFDGAKVLLGYTDWRADQIVDQLTIDKQIGTAIAGGRFGMMQVPIYGKIVHEVSYAIYFNDAIGWRPEKMMNANTASRLLPAGRTAFESTESVPAGVTNMQLYARVKTYVIADYSGYANPQKWYADGAKVLKADKYDNPNGAFTNYDFQVQ